MTIFFYGPNTYELRRQLREMVAAYVTKAGSDFGLERVDGASVRPRDLAATLQTSPFLANSRLVVVEGLALNKAAADRLADTMAAVPKSTVAVFVDPQVDQRTTVFKQLMKADKVVKFEQFTGPKLLGWAKAEVEKLGGQATPPVIRELVDVCGEDQWRLAGEINKLVNYDPKITSPMIRELVVPSVEQSIFELVEAMTDGRVSSALAGYHRLLEHKESEIYILTMVQWQLRNLILAKTAPAAMGPGELAKAAGMSPYVAGKMIAAQGRIDEDVLVRAYADAAACELDIKTGRLKAEVAVEQLIYRISKAAPGKR